MLVVLVAAGPGVCWLAGPAPSPLPSPLIEVPFLEGWRPFSARGDTWGTVAPSAAVAALLLHCVGSGATPGVPWHPQRQRLLFGSPASPPVAGLVAVPVRSFGGRQTPYVVRSPCDGASLCMLGFLAPL